MLTFEKPIIYTATREEIIECRIRQIKKTIKNLKTELKKLEAGILSPPQL